MGFQPMKSSAGCRCHESILFRRTGVGVCFDFLPLFIDNMPQLALHRFESVVNRLVQRLVCAVIHLLFFRDELVTWRNGHIEPNTVRISFLMPVIRLLDGHVATVNVIAKFLEPRRVVENEIVDGI